jgi:ribosomal protein L7/L12
MDFETEIRNRIISLEQKVDFLLRAMGLEAKEQASVLPPDDITMLLRQGRKIEAIKIYREKYGVGLKEAKDAVDRMG